MRDPGTELGCDRIGDDEHHKQEEGAAGEASLDDPAGTASAIMPKLHSRHEYYTSQTKLH